MTQIISYPPLRPIWTNRQRISAADLTAEQTWQDVQLNRLRQYSLGWGVVVGFEVQAIGNLLQISPGYGITAMGSEIYLPEVLELHNVYDALCLACGEETDGCADPTGNGSAGGEHTGWLALQPATLESCPRPTVPEGCAHPGSDFAYSRQGSGLEPIFYCVEGENSPVQTVMDCELIESYLQGERPVPMPQAGDDHLPIALMRVGPQGILEASEGSRRVLLPVTVLQDIVACCDCHPKEESAPETDTDTDTDTDTNTDTSTDGPWSNPFEVELGALVEDMFHAMPNDETFGMTFKDIIGSKGFMSSALANAASVNPVVTSFAASLVVETKEDLEAFIESDFVKIFESMAERISGGKLDILRGWGLEAEAIYTLTFEKLWGEEQTAYHSVLDKVSPMILVELQGVNPADFVDKLGDLLPAEMAAIVWAFRRALLGKNAFKGQKLR